MNYSDVFYDGLTDKSHQFERISNPVGYPLVIGMFRRGRIHQIMMITLGNIDAILGYDPDNPYYNAVLDFLNQGIEVVNVLRVARYSIAYEAQYTAILPKGLTYYDDLYSDVMPLGEQLYDELYSRILPLGEQLYDVWYSHVMPVRVERYLSSKKYRGFEPVERYLSSLMYLYFFKDILSQNYQVHDGSLKGIAEQDILNTSYLVLGGELRDTLKRYQQPTEDYLKVNYHIYDSDLRDILKRHNQPQEDSLNVSYHVYDGELKNVLIRHQQPAEDRLVTTYLVLGGDLT